MRINGLLTPAFQVVPELGHHSFTHKTARAEPLTILVVSCVLRSWLAGMACGNGLCLHIDCLANPTPRVRLRRYCFGRLRLRAILYLHANYLHPATFFLHRPRYHPLFTCESTCCASSPRIGTGVVADADSSAAVSTTATSYSASFFALRVSHGMGVLAVAVAARICSPTRTIVIVRGRRSSGSRLVSAGLSFLSE